MRFERFGFLLGAVAAFALGCQMYDFEPLQPLTVAQTTQTVTDIGKVLLPNIMIVVDRSGSMTKPVHPESPACLDGADPNCCGTNCQICGLFSLNSACAPCGAGCSTRLQDLQSAMSNFLTGPYATVANWGLMELPGPGATGQFQCVPSAQGDVLVSIADGGWSITDPSDAGVLAQAALVNQQIQAIQPLGGTPTAATLAALASDPTSNLPYQPLVDPGRQNFVLLLTDGEPNCNSNNPNDCSSPLCQCTRYTGIAPPPGECPGPNCLCATAFGNCQQGCIDTSAVVQAVDALRKLKIRTIPVGFGLETLADAGVGTGYAPNALNAMAIAGGFSRSCSTGQNSECNPTGAQPGDPLYDTCDVESGLLCEDGTAFCCMRRYYDALDQSDLETALGQIARDIPHPDPCVYPLKTTPKDQSLLVARLNGTDVPATDSSGNTNWTYQATPIPTVTFQGSVCTELQNATAQQPVQVQFLILSTE